MDVRPGAGCPLPLNHLGLAARAAWIRNPKAGRFPMRSLVWLTSLTLVASAVATVAVVDYAQRHPETTAGQYLLALRGKPAAVAATAPRPTAEMERHAVQVTDLETPRDPVVPPLLQNFHEEMQQRLAKPAPAAKVQDHPFPFVGKRTPVDCPICRLLFWCCDAIQIEAGHLAHRFRMACELARNMEPPPASLLQPEVTLVPASPTEQPRGSLELSISLRFSAEPKEREAGGCCMEEEPEDCREATCSARRLGCCASQCGKIECEPARTVPAEPPAQIIVVEQQCMEQPRPAPHPIPESKPLITRFYRVDDLLTDRYGYLELIETIQRMVAPGCWGPSPRVEGASGCHLGPCGDITFYSQGRMLIVRQSAEVHEQLQSFLAKMREEMTSVKASAFSSPPRTASGMPIFELPPKEEACPTCRFELRVLSDGTPCRVGPKVETILPVQFLTDPAPLAFPDDADTILVPELGRTESCLESCREAQATPYAVGRLAEWLGAAVPRWLDDLRPEGRDTGADEDDPLGGRRRR